MKIGIIDADLLGRSKHRFPNLVCEKLSGYWNDQGAETILLNDYDQISLFDHVYISKVFTDTPVPEWVLDDSLRPKNVSIGGTGFYFDQAPNLPDEIEHHMPNYDLYNSFIEADVQKARLAREAEGKEFKEKNYRSGFKEYTDYSIGFLRIMERYTGRKKANNNTLSLFKHQSEMVQAWTENHYAILAEMATGTGKTRSAIGCMLKKLKDNEKLLVIVSTPQNTLSRQWLIDFQKLGIALGNSAIIDGTNSKWKRDLEYILLDIATGVYSTAVVFTTHRTSSNSRFLEIIKRAKGSTKVLFICDEVHAVATEKQEAALDPVYEYRIGLSATPDRMFDDVGTQLIRNYFGNKSFEFTIHDALHTINPTTGKPFLNSFEYHPLFVVLADDEYSSYKKKTRQIAIEQAKEDKDEERIRDLRMKRALILKNARQKYDVLQELINEMGPQSIKDTLLFVSDKQIGRCMEILAENHVSRAKITEEESASRVVNIEGETERQKFIADFTAHRIQMLLAIKCLDEGIDIPNARIALLMSNGTNPREYIQRIGRVIRQAKDKPISHIYDFIAVAPDKNDTSILSHEARRAQQIAQNAQNYHEVERLFIEKGVDINAD